MVLLEGYELQQMENFNIQCRRTWSIDAASSTAFNRSSNLIRRFRNIRRVVIESELIGSTLALQPNHSEDEVQKWNQLLDKLAETELKATYSKKRRFPDIFPNANHHWRE